MLVETFEVLETELAEHAPEMEAEAIEIIESLGLTGQQGLLTPAEDGAVITRLPYRIMTAEEQRVYSELCPTVTSVEEYSDGPIPLRVLQVAAHAKECGLFDEIHVWYSGSIQMKDPVLVGTRKPPGRQWGTETFILARWGEELEDLGVLRVRAVERWVKREIEAAKAKTITCKQFIETVAHQAERHFNGDFVPTP